jgi:hypothetical protein
MTYFVRNKNNCAYHSILGDCTIANAQEQAITVQLHPKQLNWKKPEHTKNMFYFLLQFRKHDRGSKSHIPEPNATHHAAITNRILKSK